MSSISPIAGNAGQAAKTVDRDSDHGVSKPATSTARATDIAAGINTVNIKA